ncbi:hypothetical protein BDQ17DRAFT_1363300 [Cyathus striatus]|nr:hypothetical protein BDQ17DRAFT_1363300 [Cyathus striatus]
MGQHWTFFNLDKMEAIGLSKLQEWYFTDDTIRFIQDTINSGPNSLAGDRIICFGDKSDADSLPAGVLSDELWSLNFEEKVCQKKNIFVAIIPHDN